MANSINPRATPGAGLTHPVQQAPAPQEATQRPAPIAQLPYPIGVTGASPLSADRVVPGSANPQIAREAARVSQAARPAVFCVGNPPQEGLLRLPARQDPRQRVPTPPPHLVADSLRAYGYAFESRAPDARDLLPKRSPSP